MANLPGERNSDEISRDSVWISWLSHISRKVALFYLTTSKTRMSVPVSWPQAAQCCQYSNLPRVYMVILHVQVQQFLYRPVTGPEGSMMLRLQVFMTVGTWNGKVVCPTYRLPLPPPPPPPPRKYFKYSFLLKAESTPGP